jgi:hypothetical protein
LNLIILLVYLKMKWILFKSFEQKLIDKSCSQNLSSWSVDVDGIFPNKNFWIFVRKTLFASPQFSRPETSWNIILFKKNVCSMSQNYIWNIGLLLNESKKSLHGWMMCSYWFFFKLIQFISEQSLEVNQEAFFT